MINTPIAVWNAVQPHGLQFEQNEMQSDYKCAEEMIIQSQYNSH